VRAYLASIILAGTMSGTLSAQVVVDMPAPPKRSTSPAAPWVIAPASTTPMGGHSAGPASTTSVSPGKVALARYARARRAPDYRYGPTRQRWMYSSGIVWDGPLFGFWPWWGFSFFHFGCH
jgi:hypothetical protein